MHHIFVASTCGIVANVAGLKEPVRSYRDLVVWRKSMAFVAEIYRCTQSFPQTELYGMISQLRRAAVSVPSNIAEGQARLSTGEFKEFLGHARGSLMEVETQILVAAELGYLKPHEVDALLGRAGEVGRLLNGLLRSLPNRRT
jgi:four helix bundle protein